MEKNPPRTQPRNPLHGITLEMMLLALLDAHGWAGLASRVPVRCFAHDPSLASSLKFLRRTPWARNKVEALYRCLPRQARATAAHPKHADRGHPQP